MLNGVQLASHPGSESGCPGKSLPSQPIGISWFKDKKVISNHPKVFLLVIDYLKVT